MKRSAGFIKRVSASAGAIALVIAGLSLGLGGRLVGAQVPVPDHAPCPLFRGVCDVPSLNSIHMIDALTGWAVTHKQEANTLLRTIDGGTQWTDVTPLTSSGQQVGAGPVAVLTSSTAWVANGTKIFHTIDGGRTWRKVALPAGPSDYVTSIDFINPREGWLLVATGVWMANEAVDIYRSTDGGENWVKVAGAAADNASSGLSTAGSKGAIAFRSATTGWITGANGPAHDELFLYVTYDSGRTWREQGLSVPPQVTSPWFAETAPPKFFTARDGILPVSYSYGTNSNSYGSVVFYVTHDGGMTWTYATPVPATLTMWNVTLSFVDMNRGWATDGDALYETSNGGRQWTRIPPAQLLADVKQLDFISPQVGWAVIKISPYLLKTLDGGRTWIPVLYTISRH